MGPSTDKGDVMEQLVREGMDVARFNFSHGPHDEQRGRIQKLSTQFYLFYSCKIM